MADHEDPVESNSKPASSANSETAQAAATTKKKKKPPTAAATSASATSSSIAQKPAHKNKGHHHHHHHHHSHHASAATKKKKGANKDDGDDDEHSENGNDSDDDETGGASGDGGRHGGRNVKEEEGDDMNNDGDKNDEDDEDEDDDDEDLDEFDTDDDFLVKDNEVDEEEVEEEEEKPRITASSESRKRKHDELSQKNDNTTKTTTTKTPTTTTTTTDSVILKGEEGDEPSGQAQHKNQDDDNEEKEEVEEEEEKESTSQRKRPKKRLTRLVKRRDLVSPSEIMELRDLGRRYDEPPLNSTGNVDTTTMTTTTASSPTNITTETSAASAAAIGADKTEQEAPTLGSLLPSSSRRGGSGIDADEIEIEPRASRRSGKQHASLDLSMAGFEDDDEDDEDENADYGERRFGRRGMMPGIARSGRSAILREVREIFGDDIGLDELGLEDQQYDEEEEEEEEDFHAEEEEGELIDNEGDGRSTRRRSTGKTLQLRDQFEPDVLKERFFTEPDELIRRTDIPERLQLAYGGANRDIPTESELNEEAAWIYEQALKPRLPDLTNSDVEMRPVGMTQPQIFSSEAVRRDAYIKTIAAVLAHLIIKHFDVPFIAYYRQEYFIDVLRSDLDLWTIFDWDLKWMRLLKRKRDIQNLLKRLLAHLSNNFTLGPAQKEARQRLELVYSTVLDNSTNMEDIVDLSDYINLYFTQEIHQLLDSPSNSNAHSTGRTTRKPLRRDLYAGLTRDGLGPLKDRFGFTAGKYADNLDAGYVRHPVIDDSQDPLDAASNFISDTRSDEQALAAARLMLAIEISTEPIVRSKLRILYDWNATLRVVPTKKGQSIRRIAELCAFASGRPIKWFLSHEPHLDVAQQQQQQPISQQALKASVPLQRFLDIMKSESDGLLIMRIEISPDVLEQCLETKTYLMSDKTSSRVRFWNEQREAVMTLARERLHNVMEQYVRRRYVRAAQEWVALMFEQDLFRLAVSGPCGMHRAHLKDNHQDQLRPELMSTLVACQGSETEPTTFVFIDVDGQVVDHLQWVVPNTLFNQRTRSKEVQEQKDLLKGFIRRHEPDTIAVGVNGMNSRRLFMDISALLDEMKQDAAGTGVSSSFNVTGDAWGSSNGRDNDEFRDRNRERDRGADRADEDDEFDRIFDNRRDRSQSRRNDARDNDNPEMEQGYNISAIKVVWVPEDVARVFEVSARARTDLPDLTGIMRRAVSIGRRLQDPLTEVAGLCNEDMDVLSLRLHRLQDAVSRDLLVAHAERALARAVNAVGVDINRMISRKHTATVLPFLSGLGPRKAQYMLTRIAQLPGAQLLARKDLLEAEIVDKVVFKNCAGFIRITYYTATDPDLSTKDVLEETRIHPEAYILTVKMCTDALECDNDPDTQQLAVEQVMNDPQRLDELDLDAYAAALAKIKEYGRLEVTLRNIRTELQRPFRDPRGDFCPLTEDELFELMTGETDETLQTGTVVSAVVTRVGPRGVSVRLPDSELSGFIPVNCVDNLEQMQSGQGLFCIVTGVDKKAYSLALDARSSVVLPRAAANNDFSSEGGDSGGGMDASASPHPLQQQRRQVQRQQHRELHQRQIDYPYFENVDYDGAKRRLQDKPEGELVVRPSRKGDDHLSITFKFFGDKYINVDVQERDKKDRFSIGQRLFIGKQEFQSLDHIEVEYVTQMVEHARKLMAFKHYMDAPKDKIEATLRQEKSQNRQSIPYRATLHPDHPGKFIIYYLPGDTRIKHDTVTITPHGYQFHRKEYNHVIKLINAFKRYVQDAIRLRNTNADDE